MKSTSALDSSALSLGHQVAIQGERGSNSHMAALAVLAGEPGQIIPCASSADVFARLEDGSATIAVLPIENSLHGSVFEHYDLLLEHPVSIIGETMLHIEHHVIAAPGARLAQIVRILSHPVALSQCRRWLREHPAIEAVPAYDTAGSVKHLMADGLNNTAAIAPRLAAEVYGAEVIGTNVEDHPENYTRFYVLTPSVRAAAPAGANKASLAFSLDHRPGTLIEALTVFRDAGINLTRIESRPVPGRPWEYIFFTDLRFPESAGLERALMNLRERCQMVRELGHYVAAEVKAKL